MDLSTKELSILNIWAARNFTTAAHTYYPNDKDCLSKCLKDIKGILAKLELDSLWINIQDPIEITKIEKYLFNDIFNKLYPKEKPKEVKVQEIPQIDEPLPKEDISGKILVLSDIHIPYHNIDAINKAISNEPDADILVILGDFFDEPQHSKFAHNGDVTTVGSIQEGRRILDYLTPRFKTIYLVEGNHDIRSINKAMALVPGASVNSPFIDLLFDPDPEYYLKKRYDNVFISGRMPVDRSLLCEDPLIPKSNNLKDMAKVKGYSRMEVIGDVLFLHADRALKNPGTTLNALVKDQLPQLIKEYGLPKIRCIVQAHTHKLSKVCIDNTYLGIECGCLMNHQTYEEKTHVYGTLGYAVIVLKNGKVDWNESTFKFLEEN